jgi:Leucine-rich repeat (LRR) protein
VPKAPSDSTFLSLSNNQISRLTEFSFTDRAANTLTRLVRLNLRQNEITSIGAGTFTRLTRLEILDMTQNRLDAIADNSFATLTALRILRLSSNKLTTVTEALFNRLTSLEELYLDNNNITQLPDDIFAALRRLRMYVGRPENARRPFPLVPSFSPLAPCPATW